MLRVKAIGTLVSSTLLLAACGQIIGLGDYTEVEGNASGKGGKGGSAGAGRGGGSGRGGSTGDAGESGNNGVAGASAGDAGEAGASTGQGGTAGSGGAGGTGNTAGQAGEGGVDAGGASGSGGTGGSAGAEGGSGGVGGAGAGGEGGAPPRVCTEITLVDLIIGRENDGLDGQYYYWADFLPTLGGVSADYLTLQFFHGNGYDGGQNGTFDLGSTDDAQYATCARCIVLYEDRGTATERLFFQESGTLYLAPASDQMSGYPLAELSDVTLIEITWDENFISTPVDGGACLHLTQGSIAATPEEPAWDIDVCVPEWRTDGICDCGCGGLDPDCSAATSDVCEGCYCADDNAVCNAESNWLCDAPVVP